MRVLRPFPEACCAAGVPRKRIGERAILASTAPARKFRGCLRGTFFCVDVLGSVENNAKTIITVSELRSSMAEARRRQCRGFSRRPKILDYLGAGGLDEGEARQAASKLVRPARAESGQHTEGPAPEPDAVR
ncbi:hypothetical protein BH23ACT11_BH23ACT11_18050 [soil metagenome]